VDSCPCHPALSLSDKMVGCCQQSDKMTQQDVASGRPLLKVQLQRLVELLAKQSSSCEVCTTCNLTIKTRTCGDLLLVRECDAPDKKARHGPTFCAELFSWRMNWERMHGWDGFSYTFDVHRRYCSTVISMWHVLMYIFFARFFLSFSADTSYNLKLHSSDMT
jgi:hypothetical protein